MMRELDIQTPKNEKMVTGDPFLILGYGMNAYFDMMKSLIIICLSICFFLSPVFYGYSHPKHDNDEMTGLMKFTLGNLGAATVQCRQRKPSVGTMKMFCPMGLIMIDDQTQIGLMSDQLDQKTHCTE
jgi:hypothetical protein